MGSMKGYMFMALAMAAMAGDSGARSFMKSMNEKPYNPPRKLSPEELADEMNKRRDNFYSELVKHNASKGKEFKNWKVYDIGNGIEIVSSNIKNARKTFQRLLRENYLTEETLFEVV